MRISTRRVFISAVVMQMLFCCGHFLGFLMAAHAARHDPRLTQLTSDMRAHRASLLGFQPSILDFREYFSLNFSLLLLLLGCVNILALRHARTEAPAIRELSLANSIGMVILVGTSLLYSIPQGIMSAGFIGALFVTATLRARVDCRASDRSVDERC